MSITEDFCKFNISTHNLAEFQPFKQIVGTFYKKKFNLFPCIGNLY